MKVFNPSKCAPDDFATVESDQILVSAVAYNIVDAYPWFVSGVDIGNDMNFSVLTDDLGNVLTAQKGL